MSHSQSFNPGADLESPSSTHQEEYVSTVKICSKQVQQKYLTLSQWWNPGWRVHLRFPLIDAVFPELAGITHPLTVHAICTTLPADNQEKGESFLSNRLVLVSFTPGSRKTLHNKRSYPREAAGLQLKVIRSALSARTAFAFRAPEFILYVCFGAKTLWKAESCGLAAGATQIKEHHGLG